ncbi:MAG: FlxA-like family protein [Sphingomonadaceae bacterium]
MKKLQVQLQALQARLQQLEEAQKQRDAENAQKLATNSAQGGAVAVQSSAQPAPVVASAPESSQRADVPAWIRDTKISGKAYINLSSINQKSDGLDTAQNGTQADLKRFYLSVDHKFNNVFSANLTTDVRYGSNGVSNDTLVYVKKAYLQAKLSPAFVVRVGAADLPWVPFVEGIYGYRYVENVMIDRTKYGTSADYGVHIGGTFGNGLVSYAVSAIDGLGYKTRSRSSDTLDLSGRLSVEPVKNVVLAVGGYTGKLGKSVGGQPDTLHQATRFDALAAYTGSRIRLGAEYFEAHNWNNVTTTAADKSSGWSVFGSYAFSPKISAFGRYDWVNPNQYTNPAAKENYFNAGLSYAVVDGVDLALVYKRDAADNAYVPTSNGVIGGVNQGTYDEFGIWTQVKF